MGKLTLGAVQFNFGNTPPPNSSIVSLIRLERLGRCHVLPFPSSALASDIVSEGMNIDSESSHYSRQLPPIFLS